jgi:hypothetical protein
VFENNEHFEFLKKRGDPQLFSAGWAGRVLPGVILGNRSGRPNPPGARTGAPNAPFSQISWEKKNSGF